MWVGWGEGGVSGLGYANTERETRGSPPSLELRLHATRRTFLHHCLPTLAGRPGAINTDFSSRP